MLLQLSHYPALFLPTAAVSPALLGSDEVSRACSMALEASVKCLTQSKLKGLEFGAEPKQA